MMRATTFCHFPAALLMLAAAPSYAQAQQQLQCPRDAEPLSDSFAGWSMPAPLAAAAEGEGAAVEIGAAYELTLRPSQALRMSNLPGPVADRLGYGGIVHFTVTRPGLYRVALGGGAWVDVVRDGKALESVAHGHGPACSGIAKIVAFDLAPGHYRLTLDGNDADRLVVQVALPE